MKKPKRSGLLSVGTRVLVLWEDERSGRTTISGTAVITHTSYTARSFPYEVAFEHSPKELWICTADEVVPIPKNATKKQIDLLASILTNS